MRRSILGWLEVPVNESLWFHAMEVGHALGTLKTPAHGMGSSVIGEGFSTMQHCGQESTVTTTTTHNEPEGKQQNIMTLSDTHTYIKRAGYLFAKYFNKVIPDGNI